MLKRIALAVAAVAVAATITIVPYYKPLYSPSIAGSVVTVLDVHLAPRWLADRVILADRVVKGAELASLNQDPTATAGISGDTHSRSLNVYRFRWPLWRRIDLEYGGHGSLFKSNETLYGDSRFGPRTVGVRVEIVGKGSFKRNGAEQIVLHSHSVGGSGQYIDSYTIASLDPRGKLQRDVSVSNSFGLNAALVADAYEGDRLELSGDKYGADMCPTCLVKKGVRAQLHYDGMHWELLPDPLAFDVF